MAQVDYNNKTIKPEWSINENVRAFEGDFNSLDKQGVLVRHPSALLAVVEADGIKVPFPDWFGVLDNKITTEMLEYAAYLYAHTTFGDIEEWMLEHQPVVRLYYPKGISNFRFTGGQVKAANDGWLKTEIPFYQFRVQGHYEDWMVEQLQGGTGKVMRQIRVKQKGEAEAMAGMLQDLYRKVI